MKVWEILEATSGELLSGDKDDEILGFSQDSRKIEHGMMYIPLIGENFDGHTFIESAFNNGAIATITQTDINFPEKIVIKVKDTFKALHDMASYILKTRQVKVVGVTGSVGKTSTKDLIDSVLNQRFKTLKTAGNYNNNIGMPLTILRHRDEEVMILEMGMNHLEEIHELSMLAKPDIAVITNVGTAHIGELGSRENILKAKMEIVDGMKEGSTLVINQDNDLLSKVTCDKLKVVRVGLEQGDLRPDKINLGVEGSTFELNGFKFELLVQGKHFILNALQAIGVGLTMGLTYEECIEGVKNFKLTKNRMDVLKLGRYTLIDGTYNASKDSMISSIDVLSNYSNRKVAILADMLEMGDFSYQLHYDIGTFLSDKIDLLVSIGNESKAIDEGARDKGFNNVYHFDSNQDALCWLKDNLVQDDVVLIKGSNGMNLKEVVQGLKDSL